MGKSLVAKILKLHGEGQTIVEIAWRLQIQPSRVYATIYRPAVRN